MAEQWSAFWGGENYQNIITLDHDTSIAWVGSQQRGAENKVADTHLICAAPDLLDAATRYLYERDLYNVPPRQEEKDAEKDLRRAIAKARGEERDV